MSVQPAPEPIDDARLLDTQRAFDSVAADYDGPRGNNALIQRMRQTLWDTVIGELGTGSRLLDIGCGTGIDAAEFARRGYEVTATDWSPSMVARTSDRAVDPSLGGRLLARHLGVQELDRLEGRFDGIYSNFGPLNCAPDLADLAAQCARLLRPGGVMVFSVMGRICPWEAVHYALRGRFRRAAVRAARGATAVGMNRHTIWTKYYLPREFYKPFADQFRLTGYSALSLFMPPPYMIDRYERRPGWYERLGRLDDRFGKLPLLRDMGDHFLIVMHRR